MAIVFFAPAPGHTFLMYLSTHFYAKNGDSLLSTPPLYHLMYFRLSPKAVTSFVNGPLTKIYNKPCLIWSCCLRLFYFLFLHRLIFPQSLVPSSSVAASSSMQKNIRDRSPKITLLYFSTPIKESNSIQ